MEYMTDKEIEELMEKINNDPELKDVEAPPDLHDKVMESIREYEEYKAAERLLDFVFGENDK